MFELFLRLAYSERELLITHLFEVLDAVLGGAQLREHLCSISDLLIPILLKVKHLLPDRQGDEGRVTAEHM